MGITLERWRHSDTQTIAGDIFPLANCDFSEFQQYPKVNTDIAAIDLFCGAGGLTHGLIQAGVKVKAGVDVLGICRFAYEKNNPGATFLHKDVSCVTARELHRLWGSSRYRLLAGCAPCQPFSTYRQGAVAERDARYPLLHEFERLIVDSKPHFVTMENVPNIVTKDVFKGFLSNLESAGYTYSYSVVSCDRLGVPQRRRRLVLLASRVSGIEPKVLETKSSPTVRSAFKKLPKLKAGSKNARDPLHRCASLSDINIRRIRASRPGGTWKDWPQSLRLKCHQKDSGSKYTPVYGRLSWDQPAPTITTQCYNYGSGRFGHPDEDRPISLREAALLQGFPRKYKFEPKGQPLSVRKIALMIGNAVPVGLGKAVGKAFVDSTNTK